MPLLRIERRPKSPPPAPRPQQAAPPPRSSGKGPLSAVLAGAGFGVVLIAAIASFALGQRSVREAQVAPAPTAEVAAAPAFEFGSAGSSLPSADPSLPPINGDFPRDAVVALVSGQPFLMGQLEVAVRIARTLGALSGDAVPDYTAPEMRDFQVQILRRQIDIILMKQAFRGRGLEDPGLPVEGLVSGFLERVGATQEQLAQEMARNGVKSEELAAWFADSQQVNQFVQQELMGDRDQAERAQITREWLERRWDEAEIYVNFYDPDTDEWTPPSGAAVEPAGASDGQ